MTPPVAAPTARDQRLALAWQAMADGSGEILLTDRIIDELTDGARLDEHRIPATRGDRGPDPSRKHDRAGAGLHPDRHPGPRGWNPHLTVHPGRHRHRPG